MAKENLSGGRHAVRSLSDDRLPPTAQPTFWRSARAVERRPTVNPLAGAPGYVKAGIVGTLLVPSGVLVAENPDVIRTGIDVVGEGLDAAFWVVEHAEMVSTASVSLWLAGGTVYVVRRVVRRARRGRELTAKQTMERRRDSLWSALAPILGLDPSEFSARDFLIVPVEAHSDDAILTVKVPPSFAGDDNQLSAVTGLVNRRMPGKWTVRPDWDSLSLEYHRPAEPPKAVNFADYRDQLLAGTIYQVPIGIGPDGAVVRINTDADAPHFAIVARTGGGKSVLLRFILGYLLYKGANNITCLDRKGSSFGQSFDGIDGVRVVRFDVGQISDAIIEAEAEMFRRIEINMRTGDEVWPGDYLHLIIEEATATMDAISDLWKETKPRGAPSVAPAVRALKQILTMGRSAKVRVIFVMQRPDLASFGGPAVRDNIGAFVMMRIRANAIRMITQETGKLPDAPSRPKGRALVYLGDEFLHVQMPLSTPDEINELCRTRDPGQGRGWVPDGRPVAVPPRVPVPGTTPEQEDHGVIFGTGTDLDLASLADTDLVSLADGCRLGVVEVSYDTAKRARTRAAERGEYYPEEFTIDGERKYQVKPLREYYAERVARGRK